LFIGGATLKIQGFKYHWRLDSCRDRTRYPDEKKKLYVKGI